MRGLAFEVVVTRHIYGELRVYFHDTAGQLRSLPAAWTTEAPADPFIVLAQGRAHFHIAELLRLAALVRRAAP